MTAVPWPNFFIVGAPRSGTTSLYHYLKQHPQVFMSRIKEPRFFAIDGQRPHVTEQNYERPEITTNLSDYLALFRDAYDAIAVGEASTAYLNDESAPGAIADRVPNARIVAILRHPAERAFSAFQYKLRDGREPLARFKDALAAEAQRVKDGKTWYEYKGKGFYARALKRYFDRFDRSRIRVYLSEDLFDKPVWMMRDLFEFLGVDTEFTPDVSIRHSMSGRARSGGIQRWLTGKQPLKEVLKKAIPEQWGHRVISWVQPHNMIRGGLDPDTRLRLTREYSNDIRSLQDLIGRDLSHWLA
jgi:Sulfotransferase family